MPTKQLQIENPQQAPHTENKKNIKNNTNKTRKEIKSTFYFSGKSHKFNITESQAHSNSKMMDNIIKEINEERKDKKLTKVGEEIKKQYKKETGEDIELTLKELKSILQTHELDGKLGEVTFKELKEKVKELKKTIKNKKLIRFLIESGFCGQEGTNNDELDINKLAKKLNLTKYEKERIEDFIEQINKSPMDNGINLKKLPILEILRDNYKRIIDLTNYVPEKYKVHRFFNEYLAAPERKLRNLNFEDNKELKEILSSFSKDIKNKCKNAGIDIDEILKILTGEISLQEAHQICQDEEIIELAKNEEGKISKHALELAIKLKRWNHSDIKLLFEKNKYEYLRIKETIKYILEKLSRENLQVTERGAITAPISEKELYDKYRTTPGRFYDGLIYKAYKFEDLLNYYLIDGGRYTDLIKNRDIITNILVSFGIRGSTRLYHWYTEMNEKEQSFLAKLIIESQRIYDNEKERETLAGYKGRDYEYINKDANNPKCEASKIISQYLEKMPLEEDIEVEREDPEIGIAEKIKLTINGETRTLQDILRNYKEYKDYKEYNENDLEQKSFIRDSFISTYFKGKVGNCPIKRHFTVKKGVGACFLDVLGFNTEKEILLDKNCKITITKLKACSGTASIYATVEKI